MRLTWAVPVLPANLNCGSTSLPLASRRRWLAVPRRHDLDHALADQGHVLRIEAQRGRRGLVARLGRRQLLARRRRGEQQVGLHLVAAVGDAGRHDGELQRRRSHEALADAEIEGVAVLPGLAELLLLPGAAGLDAGRFAGQAELADAAEAQAGADIGDAVDAGLARGLVEEAVAGLGDRLDHVGRAVAALQPAMELDVAELEMAHAGQPRPRLDRLGFQRRQRRHHLVGRARRIDAGDRLVVQRPLRAVEQLAPFGSG